MKNKNYDLVIIGGGSAGLASSIGAYDEGIRKILILEKDKYLGGILNQCIHNGFGLQEFKEELTGPEFAQRFIDEVTKRNIEYQLNSMVLKITKNEDSNELEVSYSNENGYQIIKTKSIIYSTGCSEKTRGNINLQGTRPTGVITAGLAQRYLNIDGYLVGKRVFILGSGDIGLIMARRMTLEGAKVLGVAELMPYSNGLNRNIVQCLNDYNIPLYLHHTVKEIIGKDRIEKVVISKVDDNLNFIEGEDMVFDVDTLLLSVGLIPSNPLLESMGVLLHPRTKGPIVDENLQTSVKGLFACGNSLHVHDLVDYVTAEGRLAGKNAAKYLKGELNNQNDLEIQAKNGVGYVLPTTGSTKEEKIVFKFRVSAPLKESYIIIKNNDVEVKRIKKLYMLPAEMQMIEVNTNLFTKGTVTIEVMKI